MSKRVPALDVDALLAPAQPIAALSFVARLTAVQPIEYRKPAALELPQP